MNMTVKEFNLWLVQNDYTQENLASKLGLTPATVSRYKSNGRFPATFVYSLLWLGSNKSSEG